MNLYESPYTSFSDKCVTKEQRVKYCTLLEQEYRGDRILLDEENIDQKYRFVLNTTKIKACSIYVPIVKQFVDEENNNYDNGVIRQFRYINGKTLPTKINDYLDDLYEQSKYNLQAMQWEHEAALYGTVIIRPAFDERTGLLHWIRLIPADHTLDVKTDPKFNNIAAEISYKTGSGEDRIEHVWDWTSYKAYKLDKSDQRNKLTPLLVDEEHKFKETPIANGGLPWTILRYTVDNRTFWGPFDGGLAALVMLRSFLLADSVHRTQASMYEILVMSGYTPDEAIAAVKQMASGKVILAEKGKSNPAGEPIDQDVKYVSPQGMEPSKVLDHYLRLYDHIRQIRGHSKKNFEVGADVQSFEAQRLAEGVLRRKQLQNRPYLLDMEKRNLRLLIAANNRISSNPKIPENIEVTLDWVDGTRFANMKELSEFAVVAVQRNWMTDPQIIKLLNPDLTTTQAEERYEQNKEVNSAKPSQEPSAEDVVAQDKGEGNPIPKPNMDESHDGFIARGMKNEIMVAEYPDEKQRLAILEQQWKKFKE